MQHSPISGGQAFYRSIGSKTLIILVCACIGPVGFANSPEENWPEPVYFPQKQTTPEKDVSTKPEKDEGKKWFWPFEKKAAKETPGASQAPNESKTGPKDPPASPYPLIRIPMAFQTNQGPIPTGIYLLQPSPCQPASDPSKPSHKCFSLTQRNKRLLVFEAHPVSLPDINLAKEGTPSPLSKADPQKPDPLIANIKLSPDQKTLSLQVQQGQNTLESDPFPVFVDQRTILTY
ncbi:hypothetical protein [Vampirovibrio chlorellavorus]|uniref:hypothetical protein n=1 Tax=Vampirovibrio chlorellavorus TaxID=758823 RepID=UPI0026EE9D70|nr:hypothetical protein [Vampirovibrio chlorellavorus]